MEWDSVARVRMLSVDQQHLARGHFRPELLKYNDAGVDANN